MSNGNGYKKMKGAGEDAQAQSDQDETSGIRSCLLEKKEWIEVELLDEDGAPIANEECVVIDPDGEEHPDKTSSKGIIRVDCLTKGQCKIFFPKLDQDAFEEYTPPEVVLPEREESSAEVLTTVEDKPVIPKVLELTAADEKFAPKAENLSLTYNIKGLIGETVVMRVSCEALGETVCEIEFNGGEKGDGDGKVLNRWDGRCDRGPDTLKDKFLNPLYSPYKVSLVAGALSSEEKDVKVLYHSIRLKPGPWLPPDDEPDFDADVKPLLTEPVEAEEEVDLDGEDKAITWLQWQLNKQGYFAGKVDGDLTSVELKKAIRRYNYANLMQGKAVFDTEYDSGYAVKDSFIDDDDHILNKITEGMLDGLNSETHAREVLDTAVFENEDGDPTEDKVDLDVESSRFYVEDAECTSLNSRKKWEKDAAWLSRPWFPVMAEILIQAKSGDGVEAFGAVGPVGVKWTWADATVDMTHLLADPNTKTKEYIEKTLAEVIPDGGYPYHNVQETVGGVLKGDDTDRTEPFVAQTKCPGHIEDDYFYCQAYADDSANEDMLGRACVGFSPSTMGGDNYTITAAISLTDDGGTFKWADDGNKGDFATEHDGVKDDLSRSSGKIELWRKIKVAVYLKWAPDPDKIPGGEWTKVANEYKAAFIKMEVPAGATAVGGDLKTALKDAIKGMDGNAMLVSNGGDISTEVLQPRIALPDSDVTKHYDEKKKLYYTIATKQSEYFKKYAELITAAHPGGARVVVWCGHLPFKDRDAAFDTDEWRDYVAAGGSFGGPDGTAFVDRGALDLYAPYHLVAHEVGHTLFLEHWKNTTPFPQAHDLVDENCIMSYLHLAHDFIPVLKGPPRATAKADIKIKAVNPSGFDLYYYDKDITVTLEAPTAEPGWNQVQTLDNKGSMYRFSNAAFRKKNQGDYLPPKGSLKIESPEGFSKTFTWQSDNGAADDHIDKIWPDDAEFIRPISLKPQLHRGTGLHYQPGQFKPHFCGKCNLKLRGWDISAGDMPDDST